MIKPTISEPYKSRKLLIAEINTESLERGFADGQTRKRCTRETRIIPWPVTDEEWGQQSTASVRHYQQPSLACDGNGTVVHLERFFAEILERRVLVTKIFLENSVDMPQKRTNYCPIRKQQPKSTTLPQYWSKIHSATIVRLLSSIGARYQRFRKLVTAPPT